MSEYCPMCNGFEAEIRRLNGQLSAATARASELERALATETKAREMSWAHHDEHHERDNARWLKMCQALGKLADDGSPAIAWPAIFDLVAQRDTELAAMGARVAGLEAERDAASAKLDPAVEGLRQMQDKAFAALEQMKCRACGASLGLIAPDGKGETNG